MERLAQLLALGTLVRVHVHAKTDGKELQKPAAAFCCDAAALASHDERECCVDPGTIGIAEGALYGSYGKQAASRSNCSSAQLIALGAEALGKQIGSGPRKALLVTLGSQPG